MTDQEFASYVDALAGLWPRLGKMSHQRRNSLWIKFGRYPEEDVWAVTQQWQLDHVDAVLPKFAEIEAALLRRLDHVRSTATGWSVDDEQRLAWLQDALSREMPVMPPVDWIIRQCMGREPPNGDQRERVHEALRGLVAIGPLTIREAREIQARNMASYRERERHAERIRRQTRGQTSTGARDEHQLQADRLHAPPALEHHAGRGNEGHSETSAGVAAE